MKRALNEINRVMAIGDTGAILISEDQDLLSLLAGIARHFPADQQSVLIDLRQYPADSCNAAWAWGKVAQVIEQPESALELGLPASKVSAILVGPVNLFYKNPALETYGDVWRTIRRAIAVTASNDVHLFFFTLTDNNLNRWNRQI